MKRKRIIAALLTGTMLCSSVPINIRASDLDAVHEAFSSIYRAYSKKFIKIKEGKNENRR